MFNKTKDYFMDANFHWRDLAYVIFIGVALMIATQTVEKWHAYYEQTVRDSAPASEYLEVNQISIPNFVEGDNPIFSYDRIIKKTFSATWTAEIQLAGTNTAVCPSTHTANYSPDKKLPAGGPTLNWFMQREPLPDCIIGPGNYRLYVCWTIDRLDAVDARMCKASNVFTVYPKELREKLLENP